MRRPAIRLSHFDYRSEGMYLVTLVTVQREPLFGAVEPAGVKLSEAGVIAAENLRLLPIRRPAVRVVESVIMPDHIHLILSFTEPVPAGLGGVVGCLKGGITRDVNLIRRTDGAAVWQQNYWERVVRS